MAVCSSNGSGLGRCALVPVHRLTVSIGMTYAARKFLGSHAACTSVQRLEWSDTYNVLITRLLADLLLGELLLGQYRQFLVRCLFLFQGLE